MVDSKQDEASSSAAMQNDQALDSLNGGRDQGGGQPSVGIEPGANLASEQREQVVEYQQFEQPEEIVQVVYQSNQNGSLVGVESSLLSNNYLPNYGAGVEFTETNSLELGPDTDGTVGSSGLVPSAANQQISRAASTLPSVAEESTASAMSGGYLADDNGLASNNGTHDIFNSRGFSVDQQQRNTYEQQQYFEGQSQGAYSQPIDANIIYSTINKPGRPSAEQTDAYESTAQAGANSSVLYSSLYDQEGGSLEDRQQGADRTCKPGSHVSEDFREEDEIDNRQIDQDEVTTGVDNDKENIENINEEISQILSRHKPGAVESGSFRNNFRKKLGVSVSTNENDLTAHRQKFLESQEGNASEIEQESSTNTGSSLQKFKRTHSVSFNVGSSRSNRHSVDIRNLPSYLTHKRASIVDIARGAMSSLMNSFGTGSGSIVSTRRDSSPDEEPIFEEPVAPTLSLGQRVALVGPSGAEFGTVGWIGQLPDVDDDWIVGVIFDNMIGNCDGAYGGVRYFYARDNYAMFVPLSALTKTDNYIGRPETGTMMSRMSVSLKPGQLISIQRSSIRLQHCFLNAPHQRVGHDVRAVSNRLHCQCHNCGPCAHLTKQGRINTIPSHFGAHHLMHHKKNSLAHAAVEMLAHHHHHFHDEDEHPEEEVDYHFGDNAAHACNFVRYSCCQQNGRAGHEFSNDCDMVRPELLDNLIHAPKAPHRRSRPRGTRQMRNLQQQQQQYVSQLPPPSQGMLMGPNDLDDKHGDGTLDVASKPSTLDWNNTMKSSWFDSETGPEGSISSYSSSCSSRSSLSPTPLGDHQPPATTYNYYPCDTSTYRQTNGVYSTMDSQISIMDQQRFIYQRDSSAFIRSQPSNLSDDNESRTSGLGTRILRCFGCLRKSVRGRHGRRGGKRRMSARDRMIEYRRKQSTFVPSTLAKPHEDFASHGIIMPSSNVQDVNSDYSSCSKSSNSSHSSSPDRRTDAGGIVGMRSNEDAAIGLAQSMTIEHGIPSSNDQLKSLQGLPSELGPQLNYNDYTFSEGYDTYKKTGYSRDSALTDLGYSDAYAISSSSGTLKQLVDQSINDQVSLPGPINNGDGEAIISPVSSANETNISDQVDVSSPTVSANDNGHGDDVCQEIEKLDLNKCQGDDDEHQ